MDVFLRIDINLVAMIMLGSIRFIAGRRLDHQDAVNKTFLNISWIILLELLFETTTCVINKRPETWLIPISVAAHVCLFTAAPLLTYFWFCFIRNIAEKSSPPKRRWRAVLILPVAVNTVIVFLTPLNSLVFYINSDNVYHRGPLFIVSAAMIYLYLLLGFVLIIRKRRKIVRQDFIPLCVLGVLPAVGGVFQTLYYGTLLMWSGTAFSLIIVYIFLEERMIHMDYLTGAWTRHSFDYFIAQRSKQGGGEKFGVIYVDVDGLKFINDVYGHAEGDEALKTTIRIIKGTIRKNDVVGRLGGDEFGVILDCDGSREILDKTVGLIEASLAAYNGESGKKYALQCSFGADIYDSGTNYYDEFMHRIDAMMYDNKKQKRKPGGVTVDGPPTGGT